MPDGRSGDQRRRAVRTPSRAPYAYVGPTREQRPSGDRDSSALGQEVVGLSWPPAPRLPRAVFEAFLRCETKAHLLLEGVEADYAADIEDRWRAVGEHFAASASSRLRLSVPEGELDEGLPSLSVFVADASRPATPDSAEDSEPARQEIIPERYSLEHRCRV